MRPTQRKIRPLRDCLSQTSCAGQPGQRSRQWLYDDVKDSDGDDEDSDKDNDDDDDGDDDDSL